MADIVVMAGGVGGAKFVDGLAQTAGQPRLTVIGNTGDDAEFHGLWVSPDMDILTYTLADVVDHAKGWGYRGDSFASQERPARSATTPG
ncbi:MAG: 2-phospho-L-lactate transferase CofD family protein [Alphaproteobacteria bacterium]